MATVETISLVVFIHLYQIYGILAACGDIYGGDWMLVRHAYNEWHSVNDNLNGSDVYGIFDNNQSSSSSWSRDFSYIMESDELTLFMFSNSDCSEWLIIENKQFDPSQTGPYYAHILASHYDTDYYVEWDQQFIAYRNYSDLNYNLSILYAIDNASAPLDRFLVANADLSLNVWIQNKIYVTGPSDMSWTEADDYCISQNKTLASIHSKVQNMKAKLKCEDTNDDCWIGLRNIGNKTQIFEYVDNSTTDFGFIDNKRSSPNTGIWPWNINQPDGGSDGNDDCVRFWAARSYHWDDFLCTKSTSIPLCNTIYIQQTTDDPTTTVSTVALSDDLTTTVSTEALYDDLSTTVSTDALSGDLTTTVSTETLSDDLTTTISTEALSDDLTTTVSTDALSDDLSTSESQISNTTLTSTVITEDEDEEEVISNNINPRWIAVFSAACAVVLVIIVLVIIDYIKKICVFKDKNDMHDSFILNDRMVQMGLEAKEEAIEAPGDGMDLGGGHYGDDGDSHMDVMSDTDLRETNETDSDEDDSEKMYDCAVRDPDEELYDLYETVGAQTRGGDTSGTIGARTQRDEKDVVMPMASSNDNDHCISTTRGPQETTNRQQSTESEGTQVTIKIS